VNPGQVWRDHPNSLSRGVTLHVLVKAIHAGGGYVDVVSCDANGDNAGKHHRTVNVKKFGHHPQPHYTFVRRLP
jgi:hypothetical protein